MILSSIHLVHYRNYADTTFPLAQHTVFIGPNGSGKTNVVEAIRTISVTKAYRVARDSDVIEWGEKWCRIELMTEEALFEYILTTEEFGTKKVIKQQGTSIPLTQVYGLVPTVLFSPETMELIDGSPQERRRFLDTILSQSDREYIENLMRYRKVMKERHYVLLRLQQGLGNSDELDFWDSELVRSGIYLIEQRQAFIDSMNAYLLTLYPQFIDSGNNEQLVIRYKPSSEADKFSDRLTANRLYDIKTGTTHTGPHRDELVFLLADRDVMLFASRGELRRCVLATKLAEALYLRDTKQKEPIMLLDDVFSELDEARRNSFLEAIASYSSIITTTDEVYVTDSNLPNILLHRLIKTPLPLAR